MSNGSGMQQQEQQQQQHYLGGSHHHHPHYHYRHPHHRPPRDSQSPISLTPFINMDPSGSNLGILSNHATTLSHANGMANGMANGLSSAITSAINDIAAQTQSAVEDDRSNQLSDSPQSNNAEQSKQDSDARLRESAVPAACLACRSKHLKCDGQSPCARCVSSNFECVYVASRRGYRGFRRGTAANPNKRQATSPPEVGDDYPVLLGASMPGTLAPLSPSAMSAGAFSTPSVTAAPSPLPLQSITVPSQNQLYRSFCNVNGGDVAPYGIRHPSPSFTERCLESFYDNCHASHPFPLPKERLLRLSKRRPMEPLLAAMRWAGSFYMEAPVTSRQALYEEARRLINDPQQARDGFLIQAKILYLLTLDSTCENDRAAEMLGHVESLALDIGLHTKEFASIHGMNDAVVEESWRRTWWDLYCIDGMISGVRRNTNFLLFDVSASAALPCEEHEYLSGNIPSPASLEDLENKEFTGDERQFSSFAYRILSARNLGKFMRMPPSWGPDDENLARIEALLTNWRLHLPESKKDALQKDGKPDEMMFQAQMMMFATSIILHQPHSQVDSSPSKTITSCAPYQLVPAGNLFNAHTKHTIASAAGISKLITHRVPLLSHTHFFSCCVTLSSIIHLNTWALFFMPHDDQNLRQQISLNIGALNQLSRVWGTASVARGQVAGVAQEIYRIKKQQQQKDPDYWLGFTEEEALNSIATDESIIGSFDMMPAANGHPG